MTKPTPLTKRRLCAARRDNKRWFVLDENGHHLSNHAKETTATFKADECFNKGVCSDCEVVHIDQIDEDAL